MNQTTGNLFYLLLVLLSFVNMFHHNRVSQWCYIPLNGQFNSMILSPISKLLKCQAIGRKISLIGDYYMTIYATQIAIMMMIIIMTIITIIVIKISSSTFIKSLACIVSAKHLPPRPNRTLPPTKGRRGRLGRPRFVQGHTRQKITNLEEHAVRNKWAWNTGVSESSKKKCT